MVLGELDKYLQKNETYYFIGKKNEALILNLLSIHTDLPVERDIRISLPGVGNTYIACLTIKWL